MKRSARIFCAILIILMITQAHLGCRFINSPQPPLDPNTPIPVVPLFNGSTENAGDVLGTDPPFPYSSGVPNPYAPTESFTPPVFPSHAHETDACCENALVHLQYGS